MTCCAVCPAYSRKTTGVVYHLFPNDPLVREKWLSKCKKADVNYKVARVCSQHFTESDYIRDLKSELLGLKPKRVLKKDAVPSVNIPTPPVNIPTPPVNNPVNSIFLPRKSVKKPSKKSCKKRKKRSNKTTKKCTKKVFISENLSNEDETLANSDCVIIKDEKMVSNDDNKTSDIKGISLLDPAGAAWRIQVGVLCRLCGDTSYKCIPIFSGKGLEEELSKKIQAFLNFELVEGDGMPDQVCPTCLSALNAWDKFAKECSFVYDKIHELLKIEEKERLFLAGKMDTNNKKEAENEKSKTTDSSKQLSNGSENTMDLSNIENTNSLFVEGVNVFYGFRLPVTLDVSGSTLVIKENLSGLPENTVNLSDVNPGSLIAEGENGLCGYRLPVTLDVSGESILLIKEQHRLTDDSGSPSDLLHFQDSSHENLGNDDGDFSSCMKDSAWCNNECTDLETELGVPSLDNKIDTNSFPPTSPVETHSPTDNNTTTVRKTRLRCKGCSSVFRNISDFKLHKCYRQAVKNNRKYYTRTRSSCSICFELPLNSKEYIEHRISHIPVFLCEICGITFRNRSTLNKHVDIHNNQKYECNVCEQLFSRRGSLSKHRRMVHNIKEEYLCQNCGKVFHKQKLLRVHLSVHSNCRPYLCSQCGKGFKWSKNLKEHLKMHVRKQIRSALSLNAKSYNKTNDTIEKNHASCQSGRLNFYCKYCGKGFKRRMYQIIHERVHTGERPYHCFICDKRFVSKASMLIHSSIHSNNKAYKCRFCGKFFRKLHFLRSHEHTHTNILMSHEQFEDIDSKMFEEY